MIEQRLIPVIPEYMDKWLKSKPLYLLLEDILIKNNVPTEIDKWFENTKNWTLDIGTLDEFIARLKLDGYTVEKPKVFFLKNTLTYDYLYHKYKNSLGEQSYCKGTDGKPLDYCLFTLDEINSMNTGSYEQIEVK